MIDDKWLIFDIIKSEFNDNNPDIKLYLKNVKISRNHWKTTLLIAPNVLIFHILCNMSKDIKTITIKFTDLLLSNMNLIVDEMNHYYLF